MRLFLDANILFSAAWREASPAGYLFELARLGDCRLLTSGFALEEARRNIAVKRPERATILESQIRWLRLTLEPLDGELAMARHHGLPDKDVPILAAAIRAKADLLVTGDRKHFGHLYGSEVAGVSVTTLAAALSAVLGD